jgi:shikimate kinase
MSGNIILIGMPGAGKSTVGVVLAKTLGYDFIDTDIVLSRRLGSTLQTFINTRGIEAFLEAEEETALVNQWTHTVVATGGSMVLSERAMNKLKDNSIVVFLDVPLDELEKRLGNIKTRGITLRPGQTIASLYEERLPLYRRYADLSVPDPGEAPGTLEEVVTSIVMRLGNEGFLNPEGGKT